MKRIKILFVLSFTTFYCRAMEVSSLANELNQLLEQLKALHVQLDNLLIPPSLPNLGNTCYMNSVIQGFYSIVPLTNFLVNKDSFYPPDSLGRKYVELIQAFRTGSYLDQLQEFAQETDAVMQASTLMCGAGAQQDSEEFLTQLLLALKSSTNDSLNNFITYLFEISLQPLYYCPTINRTYTLPADRSNQLILPLRDPNTGQLLPNNLTDIFKAFFLPEKNVSYSPDDFEIRLAVENDFVNISVRDSVAGTEQLVIRLKRDFLSKQNLNDMIELVKNRYIKQQCTKILYLTKLPPVLIIALKRYDIDPKRAAQSYALQVNVPLQLDIAAMTPDVEGIDQTQIPEIAQGNYELQAALVHLGGLTGGHYVAYIKNNIGQWYLCNDQQIIKVTEQQMLQAIKKGYVYIYKKLGIDDEIAQEQDKVAKSLLVADKASIKEAKKRV